MSRNRVSSFFEKWSHPPRSPPTTSSATFDSAPAQSGSKGLLVKERPTNPSPAVQQVSAPTKFDGPPVNTTNSPSPPPTRAGGSRSSSRPSSMVHTYQPPLMEVANDTPPELQPIFTYLNSHSNKLYQEGYFLKLHDLDGRGRPSSDRTWQECFAQLVGTVLSLWDAAELDRAGEDGEVVPTFINLADASIKMIESLPMNEGDGQQLQNVLSISTAANNRYLLHFNSLNSLTQWTAGIRLAMYEHATLQEAYTGSLVAGKGKMLNNIRQVLERNRFKVEDWARVRFGAGTPWRRCWFVISPPDEKEWEKAQKASKKKGYAKPPILRGDVKFYETRKVTKKTRPIATITNAFSAYAIYPQSKPLIDQSTLVKIEGRITIHSTPESTTDGFVFVMPEVHPAISGFEMMLRFLFPVWDTFALYGRPNKLIADVLDQRGLMFAMPRDRRYGYLEILDVAGLIHTEGSANWNERQWRRALKDLTSKRMLAVGDDDSGRKKKTTSRTSLPGTRTNTLRFDETGSGRYTPGGYNQPRRAESAMGGEIERENSAHRRATSEQPGFRSDQRDARFNHYSSAFDERDSPPPRPPVHSSDPSSDKIPFAVDERETPSPDRVIPPEVKAMATRSPPPGPVDPPSFAHAPSQKPLTRLNQAPEQRRGVVDLDQETLTQMQQATSTQNRNPRSREPSPGQNGFGYGQGPYQQSNSRGTSPNSRHNDYRRAQNRLSTIPASPYVEHDSPILERAGQIIPPPQIEESSRSPSPAKMAASAALAALAPTPSYTRSSPDLKAQAAQDLQRMKSNESVHSQTGGAGVAKSYSVQRKPIGARTSADSADAVQGGQQVPRAQAPLNAQWNSQQYQYQPQGQPQGQFYGYQNQHRTQSQDQIYQMQSTGAQNFGQRGPSPYGQPGQGHERGQYPPQQGGPSPPVQNGQLSYRGPPPTYDHRANGSAQGQGQGWM